MTIRYTHPTAESKRKTVEVLAAVFSGLSLLMACVLLVLAVIYSFQDISGWKLRKIVRDLD